MGKGEKKRQKRLKKLAKRERKQGNLYEMPKEVGIPTDMTFVILRRLRKKGVVVFEIDDGPYGYKTVEQLDIIADADGLRLARVTSAEILEMRKVHSAVKEAQASSKALREVPREELLKVASVPRHITSPEAGCWVIFNPGSYVKSGEFSQKEMEVV